MRREGRERGRSVRREGREREECEEGGDRKE